MSLFGLKFGKKKLKGECGMVMPLSWEQRNVNTAHVQVLELLFGNPLGTLFLLILPCRSAVEWVPLNGGISTTGPATEFVCCCDMTALGKLGFGVFFIQESFVGVSG